MKKQMKVIAMLIIAVAVMLGCSIGSPVKWKAQAAETVVPEGYGTDQFSRSVEWYPE